MKHFILFLMLSFSISSIGQIKKSTTKEEQPKTITTNPLVNEIGLVFHPKFKNFYVKKANKLFPLKVKEYFFSYSSQYEKHTKYSSDNSGIHQFITNSTPIYTIKVYASYIFNNEEKWEYAIFTFTDEESYLAYRNILENYDKAGKLILIDYNVPNVKQDKSDQYNHYHTISNSILTYRPPGFSNE